MFKSNLEIWERIYQQWIDAHSDLIIHPRLNPKKVPYPFVQKYDGTDNEKNWKDIQAGKINSNIKLVWDSRNYDQKNIDLKELTGYYSKKELVYELNSEGFRDEEFNTKPKDVNVTLGCSFTFGTGLYKEDVWTSLIEKKLDEPFIHLGLGGVGLLHNLTTLLHFSTRFNIKNVFMFTIPGQARYTWSELHPDGNIQETWAPSISHKFPKSLNQVLSLQRNTTTLDITSFGAIEYVCYFIGAKLFTVYGPDYLDIFSEDFKTEKTSQILARDAQHFGPFNHKMIARALFKKYKDTQGNII